jgi:hypothetical protein
VSGLTASVPPPAWAAAAAAVGGRHRSQLPWADRPSARTMRSSAYQVSLTVAANDYAAHHCVHRFNGGATTGLDWRHSSASLAAGHPTASPRGGFDWRQASREWLAATGASAAAAQQQLGAGGQGASAVRTPRLIWHANAYPARGSQSQRPPAASVAAPMPPRTAPSRFSGGGSQRSQQPPPQQRQQAVDGRWVTATALKPLGSQPSGDAPPVGEGRGDHGRSWGSSARLLPTVQQRLAARRHIIMGRDSQSQKLRGAQADHRPRTRQHKVRPAQPSPVARTPAILPSTRSVCQCDTTLVDR